MTNDKNDDFINYIPQVLPPISVVLDNIPKQMHSNLPQTVNQQLNENTEKIHLSDLELLTNTNLPPISVYLHNILRAYPIQTKTTTSKKSNKKISVLDKHIKKKITIVPKREVTISKRTGYHYSEKEIILLDKIFQMNNYPSTETMKSLAVTLKRTFYGIKAWFIHKRDKLGIRKVEFRNRKVLPEKDIKILNDAFRMNEYPTEKMKKELCSLLNCHVEKINNWFSRARKINR